MQRNSPILTELNLKKCHMRDDTKGIIYKKDNWFQTWRKEA